jgi:hypothetical protein
VAGERNGDLLPGAARIDYLTTGSLRLLIEPLVNCPLENPDSPGPRERMMPRSRRLFLLALVVPLILTVACGKEAPPAPARVENPALGVAIAALPDEFEVVSADGETIELTADGPSGPGRAVIAAGPYETAGINLVDATKERKAWFESTPGAVYFGNRELGTPIGTAFTARGTYPTQDGEVEETWVYALHPTANRILTITFTYPTGESEDRVQQLMALLGEIEAADALVVPAEKED